MLISSTTKADDAQKTFDDIKCLALNMYHEARNQSIDGQIAVAKVTINRARHPKYPNSICDVVYQKNQFSWTRHNPKVHNQEKMNEIFELAYEVYMNYNGNDKSLFFHSTSVKPYWSHKMKRTKIVGKHIFYKE